MASLDAGRGMSQIAYDREPVPDEWPEPEGGFARMADPLRRALLNSPLYACPDLDSEISEVDIERAMMEDTRS